MKRKKFDNGDTAMRLEIVKIFLSKLNNFEKLKKIKNIAVVGGRLNEPEIQFLNLGYHVRIDSFGIDQNSNYYYDLNNDTEKLGIKKRYDLVICAQVLEHIWNLPRAITNLGHLCGVNGLLWLNCPTSNRVHYAPDYYSAGYPPEILIKHLALNNFKVLDYGVVGSKRYYYMNHALSIWATPDEHMHPILKYEFGRLPGPLFVDFLRFIRDLPNRLISLTKSSEINNNMRWATETWILAKKPNQ